MHGIGEKSTNLSIAIIIIIMSTTTPVYFLSSVSIFLSSLAFLFAGHSDHYLFQQVATEDLFQPDGRADETGSKTDLISALAELKVWKRVSQSKNSFRKTVKNLCYRKTRRGNNEAEKLEPER